MLEFELFLVQSEILFKFYVTNAIITLCKEISWVGWSALFYMLFLKTRILYSCLIAWCLCKNVEVLYDSAFSLQIGISDINVLNIPVWYASLLIIQSNS